MALTQDDLQSIRAIVKETVDDSVKMIVDEAVEGLAIITAEGFRDVYSRLDNVDKNIAELKTDVAELKSDVAELKTDVSKLKFDVAELKTDMREVKYKLTDVTTRSELSDLRYRVERLEATA